MNFKNLKLLILDKDYKKKLFFVTDIKDFQILKLTILFILISLTEVLSLALIYPFIDFVINKKEYIFDYLNFLYLFSIEDSTYFLALKLGLIIIFVFFSKHILSIFMRWRVSNFIWYKQSNLQIRLMKSYQLLDYEIFSKKGKAELVNNLKELTRVVIQSLEGWLKLISEIVIFLFIFLYLIKINFVSVVVLLLVFSLAFIFYQLTFSNLIKKLGEDNLEGEKSFFSTIDETIKGFKEFRILRKEDFFLNKAQISTEKIAKSNIKNEVLSLIPRFLLEFLAISLLIFLVLILLKSNQSPTELLPLIGVFSLAAIRIIPGINLIILSLFRINYGSHALATIFNDLNRKIIAENKSHKNLEKIKFKNLKIDNLDFNYENSKEKIFKNLSLEINVNDCVGIIGSSGIGKTSLIDLVLGLLKPKNGSIFINGEKLNDHKLLYNLTSYMPQDPVVLDGSIESNITLETNQYLIDREKLKKALKFAELDNFVDGLEKKNKTLIGENGINLSGGQKQRLALARGFYFNRDIVILDEATSSLDKETSKNIVKNIELIKNKKTLIIISHNMETLKNCNKIFKIENQKLVLDGKY